ncbi:hypothetical protein N9N07_04435 [Pseudomonadales bacterium]|nr:hypothetical protein [Pseudomonadales bacterium]
MSKKLFIAQAKRAGKSQLAILVVDMMSVQVLLVLMSICRLHYKAAMPAKLFVRAKY